MKQRLILVDMQYNGMFPKVTINISWRRFFNGIWESIINTCRMVQDFFTKHWQRRNVYWMEVYSVSVLTVLLLALVKVMYMLKTAGGDYQVLSSQLWSMWANLLSSEFGIADLSHQRVFAMLCLVAMVVICSPALTWENYAYALRRNKQLSSDERWQQMIQKARLMQDYFSAIINGTCWFILKVAGGTAIVWLVWSMLQS